MPSFSLPAEERAKARQDALAGKGGDKLKQMEKLLVSEEDLSACSTRTILWGT